MSNPLAYVVLHSIARHPSFPAEVARGSLHKINHLSSTDRLSEPPWLNETECSFQPPNIIFPVLFLLLFYRALIIYRRFAPRHNRFFSFQANVPFKLTVCLLYARSPFADCQVTPFNRLFSATGVKMISAFSTAVSGLAGFYVFFWALQKPTQHANEPPIVENAIPFLSPIIAMIAKGSKFHSHLR